MKDANAFVATSGSDWTLSPSEWHRRKILLVTDTWDETNGLHLVDGGGTV